MESAIWPIIAHLSKQARNTSPLFSVLVGAGVGSAGNGSIEAFVLIFSVVVGVVSGSAGTGAVDSSVLNLSVYSM